ncbi:MAG: hypothetical protein ABEL76_07905, partial [Bradymonadaceae bacterium]
MSDFRFPTFRLRSHAASKRVRFDAVRPSPGSDTIPTFDATLGAETAIIDMEGVASASGRSRLKRLDP